jgi:hypothetical protein
MLPAAHLGQPGSSTFPLRARLLYGGLWRLAEERSQFPGTADSSVCIRGQDCSMGCPEGDAKFRRRCGGGPTLGHMGRGISDQAGEAGVSTRQNALAVARRRIKPFVGLDVVEEGVLEAPYGGHPAGTRYLTISADCALERDIARRELEEISGLPALAWDHGWTGRRLPSGVFITLLRIFPGAPAPVSVASE